MKINLPLSHMDKVVTAFLWRDRVIVISERGSIFEIEISQLDDLPKIRIVA